MWKLVTSAVGSVASLVGLGGEAAPGTAPTAPAATGATPVVDRAEVGPLRLNSYHSGPHPLCPKVASLHWIALPVGDAFGGFPCTLALTVAFAGGVSPVWFQALLWCT